MCTVYIFFGRSVNWINLCLSPVALKFLLFPLNVLHWLLLAVLHLYHFLFLSGVHFIYLFCHFFSLACAWLTPHKSFYFPSARVPHSHEHTNTCRTWNNYVGKMTNIDKLDRIVYTREPCGICILGQFLMDTAVRFSAHGFPFQQQQQQNIRHCFFVVRRCYRIPQKNPFNIFSCN